MEANAEGLKQVKPASTRATGKDVPIWKTGVKYIVIFFMFLVFWRAKTGGISPFATGFYLALVFSRLSALILLPLYVLSAIIVNPGFDALIAAAITSVTVTAAAVAANRTDKKLNFFAVLAIAVLSQGGYVFFAVYRGQNALYTVLNLVFSLLFMYVSICAVKPVLLKKSTYKPLDTEFACMGIVLAVLSAGFAATEFYRIKTLYVFGMFVVAAVSFLVGRGAAVMAAVCVGLGAALFSFDVTHLALFAFMAAVYAMFTGAVRILSVLSAVMAAVVFFLYFNVDSSSLAFDLVSLIAGGAAYALIPQSALNRFKNEFFMPKDKLALRHLINSGREEVAEELNKVSAIFSEMQYAATASLKPGRFSTEEIALKIKQGVCAGCDKCDSCPEDSAAAIESLIAAATQKGRPTVSDAPFFLEHDCPKTAQLLSVSAEYADFFLKRVHEKEKDNRFREDFAVELRGVRDILDAFADKVRAVENYDSDKEAFILEELEYRGIYAAEALIAKSELDRVVLIVKNECLKKDVIADTVGKVLCGAFKVESVKPCPKSGYSAVALREKTDYDAVFAVASASKNREATGDTHSFIRISDTKFMMALCDGMGSGSEAGRISETAIGLVESFYRAGFDNDFILKNVNKFLSYDSGESFAAFDILVCDLNSLNRNIIKLGSPASFVKDNDSTLKIEGNALPLGALKEINPCVYTDTAADGQCVVFVSDGVSDAFGGDELQNFINNLSAKNVKSLCEAVLDEAKRLSGGEVRDDMTVTAVRLIKRV